MSNVVSYSCVVVGSIIIGSALLLCMLDIFQSMIVSHERFLRSSSPSSVCLPSMPIVFVLEFQFKMPPHNYFSFSKV